MEWKEKSPIMVGPWGGQGGTAWDDGVHTSVKELIIRHSTVIDSIQIEYEHKGFSIWSEKHGGAGPTVNTKMNKVKLDCPNESLTSITGHYGPVSNGGSLVIRSLTFCTNISKYGPFGTETGTQFSFPISGGKIAGFHGRSGWYLDSIGFYLKQTSNSKDSVSSKGILSANKNNGSGNYTIITYGHTASEDFCSYPRDYKHANIYNKMISFPGYVGERESTTIATPITYGPWGGSGGTIFDDGMYTGIRQINLTRVGGISSIKVLYDRNGQAVWGNKHGYNGGLGFTDKIIFDFPTEVVTHITGYFGPTMRMGPVVIKSLTFHTTKKVHGPFGDELGTFFSSCLTEGRIVGFLGREGWFIDGLGVHVLEGKILVNQKRVASDSNGESNKLTLSIRNGGEDVITYGVLKEPVPCGPGPWGGDGGRQWDDGVYSGIKQILVSRGKFIHSIQIEYDRGGQSVWSARHGGTGEYTHRMRFDPNEVLNCVTGYYNTNSGEGPNALRSVSFHTSRGKYGPFGDETGTYFTSNTTEGKVVGFHGRSDLYLDAIGVHMQHWLGERKPAARSSLYKYFF